MRTTAALGRRGIALPVAVFALVVIAALVAGSFFVARLENQTGRNTLYVSQAAAAADAGLNQMPSLSVSTLDGMVEYTGDPSQEIQFASQTVQQLGATGSTRYTNTVRRLNPQLFLVRSLGERVSPAGATLASQQLGSFIRIVKPTVNVNAAITVTQPIDVAGNAFEVNGLNANPPGWSECDPEDPSSGDDKVAIRSSTTTGLKPSELANVFGYPQKEVAYDPTINSDTFRDFLDYTYTTLSDAAGVKPLPLATPYNGVAPVVTGGTCDKTALLNFGEPTRPGFAECYDYLPVVHGTGLTTKFAAGSRGQGTLLIDHDLEITGGFEWSGLIIVRGSFKIMGTGNKITGAVLAESVEGDNNKLGGDVTINYSACAVAKAIANAAQPSPMYERSWVQLF